uniref:F-box domain-containing protein n=1 Tax=Moniliophthora roreri TaxID=221103 RepID=A0A0W0F5U1_MONRR
MAYTVPRPHTNHASTTPSRRENINRSTTSGFRSMPVLPQSPSTLTFQDDAGDPGSGSMSGSGISRGVANTEEDSELPMARSSTSRSSTMISRMFTPRKKVTSIISIGSSGSGHGPPAIPNSEARKKVTSIISTASQSTEEAHPISSSAPVTSPLSSAFRPSPDPYTSGNITRKGFEPVGYIAKAPKKFLWKRKSQVQESKGPFAPSFSASTTSLVIGGNQAKRKNMRRASVSGGTWRLFGRSNDDFQQQEMEDEETLSGSADEIDEIRRPSDLGPAAEVMAEEEDAKSLHDIPSDLQKELDQRFPWTSAPPRFEPGEKQRQVLTNPALLSHILTFLPTPDVACLATVSRSWSGSANITLYGCLDLRLGASGIRAVVPEQLGRDRSDTVTNHQFQAEHRGGSHSEEVESLMKRRRKLRRRLELIIDTLRVRNGELFEGTRSLLMDEWPSGWDSLVTRGEPEVESEAADGDVQDDAESIHTEYTSYSESDYTHSISDLGKGSTSSLLLDIPSTTGRRERSRSPSPVYHLNTCAASVNSSTVSATNLFHSSRKMRTHPKTLMITLLASLPSLITLCLPAFHYRILRHHTAFGLRSVEFLSEELGEQETEEMLRWLDGIVGVRALRIGGREHEKSEGEDEESDIDATQAGTDSVDDKQSVLDDERNSNSKRKRKTLLIISTPDASSIPTPSAPGVRKPAPSPTFPGTSFPMPPSSMLDKRASGVRAITGRTLSLQRPTSLLIPPAPHSPMNMESVSLPSSPMHLQTPFPVTTVPQSAPPPSASPSPTTPASSAYYTPTLIPATPITPDSHTPMSPISPTSPLTPFTPAFYLHSLSTDSLPLTPSFAPSFSGGSGIQELCLRETLLPELRVFHGPPRLVKLIVPPRRKTIREVRVSVKGTIVSGEVKIRDIIQGLRLSEKHGDLDALEKLGFLFHKDTDRRTVEKLLGAVGAIVTSRETGKESFDEDGGRGTEEYISGILADRQARKKGIHTLEVIFTPEFRMHPNVRKSDEITYKTIHAILSRYYGLQVVLLRRGDFELDENQVRLHQIALQPPTAHWEKAAAASSQYEQTEGETVSIDLVNNILSPPQGSHSLTDPTPGTTNPPENSITFPSLSPPASPIPPSVATSISLEKQKLRDRKMKRRLGSSNGLRDTNLDTALQKAESLDVLETRRPTNILSGSPEPADDEMDRETLQSNSSQGNWRNIKSVRSISSIGSLASLGSLTIATTTKAVVQVVNATKAKAVVFRASGADTTANGDAIVIDDTSSRPMNRGDSSPQPGTGALTTRVQPDHLKLEEKEATLRPPMDSDVPITKEDSVSERGHLDGKIKLSLLHFHAYHALSAFTHVIV